MTMKDFTEVEMRFEEKDEMLTEKLEIVSKRFLDLEKIAGKENETNSMKINEFQSKFDRLQTRFDEISNVMDNLMEKFYEFETQRKNNLIFYGVPEENNESKVELLGKIREVIRSQIGIRVKNIYLLYSYEKKEWNFPYSVSKFNSIPCEQF